MIPHNKRQDKNHIVSMDAEKAFYKIQHQLLVKALGKMGIEGKLFQHNKSHLLLAYS